MDGDDSASELFIPKRPTPAQQKNDKDIEAVNILLIILTIVFLCTGLGFMGWAIYERVSYNQHNSDKDDVYAEIVLTENMIDDADEALNTCRTVTCPTPVCYSCCAACTNYTGRILVYGNGTYITPGQTITTVNDSTLFGNVAANTSATRTFTIVNNDTSSTLRVTGRPTAPGPGISFVNITTTAPFFVLQYEIISIIPYTGQQFDITTTSAIITIQFDAGPVLAITSTAQVQIATSDPLVPKYTFFITANTV